MKINTGKELFVNINFYEPYIDYVSVGKPLFAATLNDSVTIFESSTPKEWPSEFKGRIEHFLGK